MRVGLFSNAYRPVVSGVVNSLDEIRKGLLKREHTPFLFAPEVKGYREHHAGVFRFPSVDLDPSVEFPVPIPYSARLNRLVSRMRLSLIHSHHPILIGQAAANFARRLKVPLVYTFHTQIEEYSHYVPFFNQATVKRRARAKVRDYLCRCDLIISPSSEFRELIDSYGVSTPIVTLPNAINLEKFHAPKIAFDLRTKLKIPEQATLSLSVGRLAPEKGLPFLLQAFTGCKPDIPHHLVLAGSGPQREELERLALALGISERVHFLGRLDYREMPEVYAQSDLFVICSTTEVKPLAVLEALASGLPVLAVSACGTRDTLTHDRDGLLCGLDQAAYQALWLKLVTDRPLRQRLSQGARETAHQYSIDRYMDRLCTLYQETLERFHSRNRLETAIG